MTEAQIEARRTYMREYARTRRANDPEFLAKSREAGRKSAAKYADARKESTAVWKAANREAIAAYNKEYRATHAAKPGKNYPEARAEWLARNPGYMKEYSRTNSARRYKDDPLYRLKLVERTRINQGLKRNKKAGPSTHLLGCSWEEFARHLESQFVDGMSWANMGQWHVDHIRPLASFDLSCPAQQRSAFHYANHQPLWAKDNLKKGAKWLNSDL